jgi:hypothetical protein
MRYLWLVDQHKLLIIKEIWERLGQNAAGPHDVLYSSK